MRTPALLLLTVGAIACTFTQTGLEVEPGEEADAAGPSGRVSPDPAGFQGFPEDAGGAAVGPDASLPLADAAPIEPSTPPVSPPSTPPPDASLPPAAADAGAPPAPMTARVLRVHDLKVGRLVAGVVHAHELDAVAGSPGLVLPPLPDPLLKLELGTEDLAASALTVDVLYAHDIKADSVQIGTTHAKLKKKGHGGGGED